MLRIAAVEPSSYSIRIQAPHGAFASAGCAGLRYSSALTLTGVFPASQQREMSIQCAEKS